MATPLNSRPNTLFFQTNPPAVSMEHRHCLRAAPPTSANLPINAIDPAVVEITQVFDIPSLSEPLKSSQEAMNSTCNDSLDRMKVDNLDCGFLNDDSRVVLRYSSNIESSRLIYTFRNFRSLIDSLTTVIMLTRVFVRIFISSGECK